MHRGKRPRAAIVGEQRAAQALVRMGEQVRLARRRRRLSQAGLAARAGISRQRLSDVEIGRAPGMPSAAWFALAEVLGIYLRLELARDPQAEPADAGHLQIQELVLRLAAHSGWQGRFEVPTRPSDPARSSDAPLLDHVRHRLLLVECWNTFGDLGAGARSSDRKLADAAQLATALGGDGRPYDLGLCWVVRDTAANRALIGRYEHIFAGRFPGPSAAWVRAITGGAPMPTEPGLVWCDLRATRLFARRAGRPPR